MHCLANFAPWVGSEGAVSRTGTSKFSAAPPSLRDCCLVLFTQFSASTNLVTLRWVACRLAGLPPELLWVRGATTFRQRPHLRVSGDESLSGNRRPARGCKSASAFPRRFLINNPRLLSSSPLIPGLDHCPAVWSLPIENRKGYRNHADERRTDQQ